MRRVSELVEAPQLGFTDQMDFREFEDLANRIKSARPDACSPAAPGRTAARLAHHFSRRLPADAHQTARAGEFTVGPMLMAAFKTTGQTSSIAG
jgi:hypothetical protein